MDDVCFIVLLLSLTRSVSGPFIEHGIPSSFTPPLLPHRDEGRIGLKDAMSFTAGLEG